MLSSRDVRQRQEVTEQWEILPLTANTALSPPPAPPSSSSFRGNVCQDSSSTLSGVRASHVSQSGRDEREVN